MDRLASFLDALRRGVGWLGLLALLLGGLALPAAAQDCPEMHVVQPANGANGLSGIVRVDITFNPTGYGPVLYVRNASGELVEVDASTHESSNSCYVEWDTRLMAKGSYELRAYDWIDIYDEDGFWIDEVECASDAITVSISNFRFTRHTSSQKILAHLITDYVPTHGGSTHPLLGFQSFTVPVTAWQHHGKSFDFALTYDSSSFVDPQGLAPVDFPGLSERNSHWSRTYAQWIDIYEDEHAQEHAIWHEGDGRAMDFAKPWTSFVSPDSYHNLAWGGGPLTSPSFPWAGGTDTLQCPYGWFVITDSEGTRYEFNKSVPSGQTHLLWKTAEGTALPHWLLTRIVDRWGRMLNITWSSGSEPRVTAVKDGNNTGLTLGYTGNLLTSVSDPQGRTHALSYTGVVDETSTSRQKLTGVTVYGPGSPYRVTHTWSFAYRDASDPNLAYGDTGAYTGDLVIQRTAPDGLVTSYRYEPISNASRPLENDWRGRISSVRWLDSSEGGSVEKVIARTVSGSTGTLTFPGSVARQWSYDSKLALTSRYHPETDRMWQYGTDPQYNIRTERTPAERSTTYPLVQHEYSTDANGHIYAETVTTRQADCQRSL